MVGDRQGTEHGMPVMFLKARAGGAPQGRTMAIFRLFIMVEII